MKIDPETGISKIIDGLTISCGKIEKTIAKEKLYKHILKQIKDIHPHFNIGISTGLHEWNTWTIPYRHWRFVPNDSQYYIKLTKRKWQQ